MKRLHVHLSVGNLDESIRFYSTLFACAPSVQHPDYAKWMLEDPRVNFAISQRGAQPGLDHLGIQVDSDEELTSVQARLQQLQPDVQPQNGTTCCYAVSNKYWVTDPQGVAWESFHTLSNAPTFGGTPSPPNANNTKACCPAPTAQTTSATAPSGRCGPTAAGTGCC